MEPDVEERERVAEMDGERGEREGGRERMRKGYMKRIAGGV
jgi:hypothetical protein